MMGERCLEDTDAEAIVDNDVLYEVVSRVDGVTLAVAACAAPVLNSLSSDEKIWERLCIQQWPSTRYLEIKSLIGNLGGFRKFYSECFPLIINRQPFVFDVYSSTLKDVEDWFDDDEELSGTQPDDFVSIVDVLFRGKPVGSRVLYGIPSAGDFHGWFSNCPFRIDMVSSFSDDDEEQASSSGILIKDGLPVVTSIEQERKDGRFWKVLWDEIRLSWIIINRKTNRMANLASWRPVSGQRHWPSDKHFLVCFGSILPVHRLLTRKVVRCNVVLKCKLISNPDPMQTNSSSLLITELSMQLEDMGGAHLNGRHSLLVLKESLSCQKSMNHQKVLNSYCEYIRAQSDFKEEKLRNEGRVDTIFIICGILSIASFCYFLF